MANEITVAISLAASKGGSTVQGAVTRQQTLTGTGLWSNTQSVGTAAEALSFPGDLTTEGISCIYIKNADPTNFVELALDSGMTNKFAKILAGEVCCLRPYAGNPTYYAKADTAACNVQMVAVGT